MSKNIIGRECRFVQHLKEIPDYRPDTHMIKEVIHYDDGSKEKKLRWVKNFQRPFYVTKEFYRNHNDKKETEDITKLNKYYSTESRLASEISSRLGSQYVGVKNMRMIKGSPYVYGIDVNAATYIKEAYLRKYPDKVTPYEVCTFDIEYNTITDELIVISIAMEDKIFTVINSELIKKKYLNKKTDNEIKRVIDELNYMFEKYIPDESKFKGVDREFIIVDGEVNVIKKVFEKAHEWEPDLMAVWNIDYDISKILEILDREGIDPADIFSAPNIPKEYKYFHYKKGATQKVTESGKYKPVNPNEQWHVINATSSFYWIDAMSAYSYIRVGAKSIPNGYGLDNVLKYVLGDKLGKLKFKDERSEHLTGLEWHIYMVENRPLEYIIYNQWDILSMLTLDDKTKDLKQILALLSGISSFDIFNSGPKRIIDAMHFFVIERGQVLGTKPPVVDDNKFLGLGSWIVLLPSYLIKENGGKRIDGNPEAITNIRSHVYDSD